METRGYTYALNNPKVKKLKLSYLKLKQADWIFAASSVIYIAVLFTLGSLYPNLLY
ncbi:hypothetical protein D3C75_669930 [compost metagenome]